MNDYQKLRHSIVIALLTSFLLFTHDAFAIGWVGNDLKGFPCNGIPSGKYGGYDYTDPKQRALKLAVVEQNHFRPQVENLQRGVTSTVYNDIYFVLREYPNHYRALNSMMKLQLRDKNKKYSVPMECFFNRAIAMPSLAGNGKLYLMYGVYLHRLKKYDLALQAYKRASKILPRSSQVYYNMGLLYTDIGDYPNAIKYAKKAYSRGFPLPGLKNRINKSGHTLK